MLNKFRELYYTLKCKKRLRHYYYEYVLKPKMERVYHPNNLIKLIENIDINQFEKVIEDW